MQPVFREDPRVPGVSASGTGTGEIYIPESTVAWSVGAFFYALRSGSMSASDLLKIAQTVKVPVR